MARERRIVAPHRITPMAKSLSTFVCQSCAYESPRWAGKCPNCGAWNSFIEEAAHKSDARGAGAPRRHARAISAVPLSMIEPAGELRIETGCAEFDRVVGGGIVAGSVI